jgi:hypothetical protein
VATVHAFPRVNHVKQLYKIILKIFNPKNIFDLIACKVYNYN